MRVKNILGLGIILLISCHRSPEKSLQLGLIKELSPRQKAQLNSLVKTSPFFKETPLQLVNVFGLEPALLLASPNSPEVVELEWKERAGEMGYFLPLNSYLKEWIIPWVYASPHFQVGRFGDDYYLLPFRYSWLGFFYAGSVLASPPRTWQELEKICARHPASMGLDFTSPNQVLEFILSLIWEFDGDEFELENPGSKSALYFLAGIKDCFSPYAKNYNLKLLADALERGEVYFAFSSPELAEILKEKGILNQEIFLAPLPGKGPVAYTSTLLGVNKKAQNPELAVRLALFLTQPRTQIQAVKKELWLAPVQPEVVGSENFYLPFLKMSSRLQPAPYQVNFSALAKIYQEIFAQIVFKSRAVELVVIDYQLPLKQIKLGLFEEKK